MDQQTRYALAFGLSCLLALGPFVASNAHGQDGADAVNATQEEQKADMLFEQSIRQLFPLSPNQKRGVRDENIEQQKAMRLDAPKELKTRSQKISLRPGASIPVIRLMANYPTTIVMQDVTGQPWPIKSVMAGNSEWLSLEYPEEGTGNILTIVPNTYEANAGVVMILEPSVPVQLQLMISSSETPDQQITLRADRPGPKAETPTVLTAYPDTIDNSMLDFLYGTPPSAAKRLTSNSSIIESWEYAGSMYVRTPLPVVWPSFQATVSSGEGETRMYAYRLPRFPQIQLLQQNGQPVFVDIDE